MKLKLTFLSWLLLFSSLYSGDTFKPLYHFENISINYLDWSSNTQEKTTQEDFAYAEFEGGAGFEWGSVYMFVDIENPTKSYNNAPSNDQRYALKPIIDISLYKNLQLHIQDYSLVSKSFYVHNMILGLSYKIDTDFGLWIQPFVAPHYQKSTYYSGFNGYIGGWAFLQNLTLADQKFSIAQWHEFKFCRDTEDGYGDTTGIQGALSFWWHPIETITTGFQYRYAYYELGNKEYQDGIIYSLKYNF